MTVQITDDGLEHIAKMVGGLVTFSYDVVRVYGDTIGNLEYGDPLQDILDGAASSSASSASATFTGHVEWDPPFFARLLAHAYVSASVQVADYIELTIEHAESNPTWTFTFEDVS